ncbi:hypothetical protein RHGRI_023087 [Rhododendron griersonianum]|uniref:Uncharacterized protein n=1 Tax=Rhododendron griersonianum TaxID=479676 RepID=A0AAV6J2F3_9ERIC|nr:hypothetical protein RHGRI_023087 [Rhododendron griersonianum]
MSSRQKSPTTRPMRGGTRRRQNSQRRRLRRAQNSSRTAAATGGSCSSVVSDKLEALKNLIPAHANGERKPDQLFQETADYIVLLKTQVLILQRLVDFYGSNQNAAV